MQATTLQECQRRPRYSGSRTATNTRGWLAPGTAAEERETPGGRRADRVKLKEAVQHGHKGKDAEMAQKAQTPDPAREVWLPIVWRVNDVGLANRMEGFRPLTGPASEFLTGF